MKKCPNCGYENEDSAKFCIECGTKLEDADKPTKEEAKEEIIEEPAVSEEVSAEPEAAEEPHWYYVDNGKSLGPYDQSEFISLIAQGKITPVTYVWTKGMSEWTYLKNTPLYTSNPVETQPEELEGIPEEDFEQPEEQVIEEEAAPEEDHQEWFYVKSGKTYGPFSRSVMAAYIEQGLLEANCYVWKEGFADWKHLQDTELAEYLPSPSVNSSSYSGGGQSFDNRSFTNNTQSYNAYAGNTLAPKSIVMYILLSILTCGIWYLVWMYQLAKDVNTIAARQGVRPGCDPALAVILSLFTCELYNVYFYYREGQTVFQSSEGRVTDNSVVLALLGFFLPIASAAILQDQINSLIQNGI